MDLEARVSLVHLENQQRPQHPLNMEYLVNPEELLGLVGLGDLGVREYPEARENLEAMVGQGDQGGREGREGLGVLVVQVNQEDRMVQLHLEDQVSLVARVVQVVQVALEVLVEMGVPVDLRVLADQVDLPCILANQMRENRVGQVALVGMVDLEAHKDLVALEDPRDLYSLVDPVDQKGRVDLEA